MITDASNYCILVAFVQGGDMLRVFVEWVTAYKVRSVVWAGARGIQMVSVTDYHRIVVFSVGSVFRYS